MPATPSESLHWGDTPAAAASLQQKALTFLADYGLPSTPINYAVAYVHAARDHAALSAAIDKALAEKTVIDSNLLRDLFAYHFFSDPTADLLDRQESFGKVLEGMLAVLAQGSKNAADYHQALDSNIAALKKRPSAEGLLKIAATLVNATVSATRSAGLMKDRLENAQRHVQVLETELKQSRREASHDPLTGLINRKMLERHLHRLVTEKAGPFSFLMLDVDHFKRINDTFGHLIGDEVIKRVAAAIKEAAGKPAITARYGGEEFSVIFPATSMVAAIGEAESIRAAIAGLKLVRRQTREKLPTITVSIGVTEYQEGDAAEELFRRADAALYHAKKNGRNRVANSLAIVS